MFGSLVQKLQSLSPVTSPTTSPTSSPKARRKFGFGKASRKRKESGSCWKEEAREVQSEPELDYVSVTRKDKRKTSAPPYYITRAKDATPSKADKFKFSSKNAFIDDHYPPHHSYFDAIYDVPACIKRKADDGRMKKRFEISKTVGRVEGIKEAERLSEYEQYFASLLVETHPDHPGYSELCKSNERLGQLLTRRDEDFGELERIQELFPNDNLRLYEKDPVSQKMKGLIRKRSTTAARLQRAFSAKGLRATDTQPHCNNNNNHYNKDAYNNDSNEIGGGSSEGLSSSENFKESKTTRSFVMETPVHLTTGVQSQERHLFLFTDLLLVAKARSGGNFKLKEKVRVSEMWMANCLDDVAEVHKSSETSFVIGWPTTNVVASFSCVATKDLWYNKLSQLISEERDKEPDSTTIQVTYYDPHTNTDICKTLNIGSTTTARECVSLILGHLEVNIRDEDKFQLWVKNQNDESPYPLIGHEFPFSIKMNCHRELLQDCEADHCNSLYNTDVLGRCQFILRQERKLQPPFGVLPESAKKLSKKVKKSPIKIHNVFKRSNSKGDVTDGITSAIPSGILFGHHLNNICEADGSLPRIVMDMLNQLFLKGPFTLGIFRKSANARLVREVKEKFDIGDYSVDLESLHITAVAALLKDFLRSLPDSLLGSDLYEDWLHIPHLQTSREKISHTLLLCSRLPRSNLSLLQHFLCVLHHIARRSSENMMSSSNLAICVGPSLLWPTTPSLALSPEASKRGPGTLEFLIERCCDIFGKDILNLLGEAPEQDPLRQDSGAEESDSLHSGHSIHSSGGMRRDDSSIDSLEREFLVEGELSPLPRKDKMSLTNLSRDSGLTMSDSQLYTPDEEESESTSSGHSGENKNFVQSCNELQLNERFQHYPAPNNPNAIYTAVYRRPERMQNIYDESESYYAAPNREHTRVHITYSSPNYNYGQASPNKDYTLGNQDKNDSYYGGYAIEEEPIYSVPSGLSTQDVLPFAANSNFKRHDWMRRRSNLRKLSKAHSIDGGLLRSSSEESLLNKYDNEFGVSLGPAGNCMPVAEPFMKGRALPPPPIDYSETLDPSGRESPLRRSKSAHQIIEGGDERVILSPEQSSVGCRPILREPNKWHRSRSTPQIHDEGDRSYDSSTLSDDDSTPHVSRSNSRGKECGQGNLHTWDTVDSQQDSRNSSFKSERTSSVCTVVSAGSTSTLSSNPPSYEETLTRRSLIQNSPQQSNVSEHSIREEKMKSARAKQLYEESLRIYQEENTYPCDLVRASPAHAHDSDDPEPPPLPPKSDPPPLPPKQRSNKRSNDGASKLKHLPPVHVETSGKKTRSINQLCFEPQTAPLHKTIIYTKDNPPCLPPKERTIIEVEANYFPDKRTHHTIATRSHSPPKVEKKSIETQTDDCDLLDDELKEESLQTSGNWFNEHHVTSVPVSDYRDTRRRGRSRRKDSPTSYRSRSMPGRNASCASEDEFEDDDDEVDWKEGRSFQTCNYGVKDLKQLDPELHQEISWSVSQLRAIFGDTLKGAKVHPPPYRPPPTSHRTPITSYHLGAGETFTCRKQRQTSSGYGEESYV